MLLQKNGELIFSGEDEMKIIASTQNPTLTQLTVAGVLGLTANKVVVTVKRMGGGFGGKESRSVRHQTPSSIHSKLFYILTYMRPHCFT